MHWSHFQGGARSDYEEERPSIHAIGDLEVASSVASSRQVLP